MRLRQKIRREVKFLKGLTRTLKRVNSIAPDSANLICDDVEAAVDKWRDRPAMTFEGKTVTYAELDGMANRYAHWAKGQGLTRGQNFYHSGLGLAMTAPAGWRIQNEPEALTFGSPQGDAALRMVAVAWSTRPSTAPRAASSSTGPRIAAARSPRASRAPNRVTNQPATGSASM